MYTDIGPSYVISSLTSSAKYPDNPSIVACESTLEPRYNIADNYGLRFTGYFHPLVDGIFKFRMQADNAAELYLTINNVETKIGEDPS